MRLTFHLTLLLALTMPIVAVAAGCSDSAMTCAEGSQWNADTKRCDPVAS
ncbi:hypothetical protein KM031_15235 [Gemmobacter fulvus]|uniref:Adenylosuccinate lyase n=1 Tax=Gemmobacter fulvus TaxID=2840474 RepID=A0A975P5D3_9RHOB|nr:hypothetical protein [Gemmobacter fulvus]MBT9247360.1 hypothetical protein [Gemmobacter fulvus]MDQ1848402.1 hypothetical protein [Gemmobacter fulvus]QWK90160.1 hypothetical protein KM031_15235 [Gemmobacter fulvus]